VRTLPLLEITPTFANTHHWHPHGEGAAIGTSVSQRGRFRTRFAPDNFMSHLAIWQAPESGAEPEWGRTTTYEGVPDVTRDGFLCGPLRGGLMPAVTVAACSTR
jgi:hypothetical protein